MPTPKPEPPANSDNPEQSRRFIDMAREVEANEDPDTFERGFIRVTHPIPPKASGERP